MHDKNGEWLAGVTNYPLRYGIFAHRRKLRMRILRPWINIDVMILSFLLFDKMLRERLHNGYMHPILLDAEYVTEETGPEVRGEAGMDCAGDGDGGEA
jgi:hypothetical protein